jgi:hypothetical protein
MACSCVAAMSVAVNASSASFSMLHVQDGNKTLSRMLQGLTGPPDTVRSRVQ